MKINVTAALREHLTKTFQLPADADDEAVRTMVSEKMLSEELDAKTLKGLIGDDKTKKVRELVAAEVKTAVGPLETKMDRLFSHLGLGGEENGNTNQNVAELSRQTTGGTPTDAITKGAGTGANGTTESIRVKSVIERFTNTKTALMYGTHSSNPYLQKHFPGRQVMTGKSGDSYTRPLDVPTERTKAIAGAWFKFMVRKECAAHNVPWNMVMNEQDWDLVKYALHEAKFFGPVRYNEASDEAQLWLKGEKMPEVWVKALLDDSVSGGLEAVPIEFDDLAIITPLLNGELYPLVTVRNVIRRRIEGFSVSNPTISWGTAEGTAIPLFDTSSFIAAFDTTIYPVSGAIESGLDFEADAPVAIGDILLDRYGEVFLKEMDSVISHGNGTTQPEGVFTASGTAAPASDNSTTGPPTVSDYERLMFAVSKEYRNPADRARQVFIGNETTYQRARAIAVGDADQRRVFGMNQEDYMLLSHAFKISQGLPNTKAGFFNLRYYRFYRRQGYQVRVVTEDANLARQNKRLIIVRARCGGQLELGGAGAVIDDAQST